VSLTSRLVLATVVVALVALGVAGVITYSSLSSYLYQQVDRTLQQDHPTLERALDSGQVLTFQEVGRLAPGAFVEVRAADGTVDGEVSGFQPGWNGPLYPVLPAHFSLPANGYDAAAPAGPPGSRPSSEPAIYFTTSSVQPGGPAFRVRVSELVGGSYLIIGLPLTATHAILSRLVLLEVMVALAALAGAAGLGFYLVRVGLRPLREMEDTAQTIADGGMDQRVRLTDGAEGTEVGRLASAFNTMLDRIEDAFARRDATEVQLRASEDRLRRFVADASHELRTPLAAVSAYAQLLERGDGIAPSDRERATRGIYRETGRMRALIEDLLLLARLDEGRPLESQPVELVGLAAESVQAARAVDASRTVIIEAGEPVEVLGDRLRLRQVVDNLLANVRAHTPPATTAKVTVRPEGADAVIEVADDGPGLEPSQLNRIFERFYRSDQSRSRESGGSGLGLSIVYSIVESHGGRVNASSKLGQGTRLQVRLPRLIEPAMADDDGVGSDAPETLSTESSPGQGGPEQPIWSGWS
jgi:two-component system OmpR family sensor kinase